MSTPAPARRPTASPSTAHDLSDPEAAHAPGARAGRRRPRGAVAIPAAVVALALPLVLTGNALWLLLTSLTVELQYALPGFPVDPDGVKDPARTALAKEGVRSIRPGGAGIGLLLEARLPDGRPAFTPRETRHMSDVRGVVAVALTAWGVALVAGGAALLALRRLAPPGVVRTALRRGALGTLVLMGVLGAVMAVDFDWFFVAFHDVLFEPGTWKFKRVFTLRQLYPDVFWAIAGAAVAFLVLLQGAVIGYLCRRRSLRADA